MDIKCLGPALVLSTDGKLICTQTNSVLAVRVLPAYFYEQQVCRELYHTLRLDALVLSHTYEP